MLVSGVDRLLVVSLVVIVQFDLARSWENSDLEMFDLVEEVGQNFYEVLGISQEATSKEIKQAYRRLSVKLHPDKNPEPDAQTKFRQLVGIYEVLKDAEIREAYHQVLRDGLPNWRQPIFYYRRYRKLALWQVVIIVLVIISIGQYLAGWAAYWEKRISIKERVDAEIRRTQRTRKAQKEGITPDEWMAKIDSQLPRPSLWDIAPIQLVRFCKYMVIQFPFDVIQLYREWKSEKAAREEELRLEEEEAERERLVAEERKKPRKRKTFAVPEKAEGGASAPVKPEPVQQNSSSTKGAESKKPVVSGGLWTDDDIAELSKLCHKYPGGTPDRWNVIASILNRPVGEVTTMAKTVLERLANKSADDKSEDAAATVKVKTKTKGGKGDIVDRLSVENWSVEEQKALESALQTYSKGVAERWDKIANAVPGRSKEECMQRFKYLAELVKKSREAKEEEATETVAEVQSTIAEPEESIEEEAVPSQQKSKGNKISKKEKRRQRDMERHSSSSSTDPDWCMVDDDAEEE